MGFYLISINKLYYICISYKPIYIYIQPIIIYYINMVNGITLGLTIPTALAAGEIYSLDTTRSN